MKKRTVRFVAAVIFSFASVVFAADAHVQRQLQLRDQQQTELTLRMQQQRDRARNPAPTYSAEMQRQRLERDQQQRLQQWHERESRAGVGVESSELARGAGERQRALHAAAEQLSRFEMERQRLNARGTAEENP